MKNEPKTEVLLRMMEQPERYTEEQWRDILSNSECRELYTLMAMTRGSLDAAKADAELTDEEIEREWEKVMKVKSSLFHFSFKKIAAIFLAAAFLGGLAWALVPRLLSPKNHVPLSTEVTTLPLEGERGGGLISFSNLRLDSILTIVSAHYKCEVCFRDTTAQALRLSTVWDREDSLSVFLETLNEFDGLRLTDERDTIFVESIMEEDK